MQPSDLFYKLKRGALISALAVILAQIIGVTIVDKGTFLLFQLDTVPANVVPLVAEIICVYYFVHFVVVFLSESRNFRLKEDGLQPLSEFKGYIDRTVASISTTTGEIRAKIVSLEAAYRDCTAKLQASPAPIHLRTADNYNNMKSDAFSAISGAIQAASTLNVSRNLPEREIRKHIRWDELSDKIVAQARETFESTTFRNAVDAAYRERLNATSAVRYADAAISELKDKCENTCFLLQQIAGRFRRLGFLIGMYRASWFARIWIFDLAIPLGAFGIAQLLYFAPQNWLAAFRAAVLTL